ncbi:MAG: GTP-binding protein, partial [Candidatus Binatia bacterium]
MAGIELDKLRNVGILGHGGTGKTSLGEAMLFVAGATQRLGRVDDGTSIFDFEPEESKRKISISTSFHSLTWRKYFVDVVDTPGYATFLADTINCMRACSGSIFVLNPSAGLRIETERLWAQANDKNIRRLLFVNKMDREKSQIQASMETILNGLEAKGVYLQIPLGAEESFRGIIDLVQMKACAFEGNSGKFTQTEIPEDLKQAAQEKRVQLMESVAETDDALLEKYLEGQELSLEELKQGIRNGTLTGKLVPILFGSATHLVGIPQLLDAVVDYLPSPADDGEVEGKNPVTGDPEKRSQDPNGPCAAYVFKTIIDPFAGKLSVMRVVSGKLAQDMTLYNPTRQSREKIGQLFRLEGKKQEPVREASAGQIVAAAKLKEISTGETLCDEKAPIQFDGLVHFSPIISF